MAVTRQVDAQTIGRHYAEIVRDLGFVRSVHVHETRDWLEVWVVTEPIDMLEEEPLYEAGGDLWDRFPEAGILVRVLNPADFPAHYDVTRDVLPSKARLVSISA